jgi:predicted homoserine dehydrogenase-like protein
MPSTSPAGPAVGHEVHAHPAALAVLQRGEALVDALLAGEAAGELGLDHGERLGVEHVVHAEADRFLGGRHAPVEPRLVREAEAHVAVDVAHRHADVVDHELQLLPLVDDRLAQAMVLLDVDHDDEDAAHLARGVAVGDEVAADAARLLAGPLRRALVVHRLAGERAVDEIAHGGHHVVGRDLVQRLADHRLGRQARPFTARAVGEADHLGAVEVGDREAHRIHDERDMALALGERVLDILQLLDVHEDHHHAEDAAVLVVQRQVMRAHPLAGIGAVRGAAVEDHRLAGERSPHLLAAIVGRGAGMGLLDRAAEVFVRRAPGMPQVFRVEVAVAHLPVDHADRQAEDVEAGRECMQPRRETVGIPGVHVHTPFSARGPVNCHAVRPPIPTVRISSVIRVPSPRGMNLHRLLQDRHAAGRPVRAVLIGAGKFGSMYLSQARRTPGLQVLAVADLAPERARASLARVGWEADRYAARSIDAAAKAGTTCVTDDAMAAIAHPATEVVIDSTGSPAAGIAHVLACCEHRKHVVMVNVEADALAGPLLARRAQEAGIVYSLAYGDQPALICELVDWARAAGFTVVAAGKGTKYLPAYHAATPATVWGHYGFSEEMVAKGDFNAQMFNSFLDGTKSGLEMAAVANATGLTPAPEGLAFPPCGVDDLPRILRPRASGGSLHHAGQVEVISSVERDGRPVFRDLRWGVYVTFAAEHEYVRRCFQEYGIVTDPSGEYARCTSRATSSGSSSASASRAWRCAGKPRAPRPAGGATASPPPSARSRPGRCSTARAATRCGASSWRRATPPRSARCRSGLAHKMKLKRDVPEGGAVSWDDVDYDASSQAVRIRREMEKLFGTTDEHG